VVPAKKEHAIGEAKLQSKQQNDHFERPFAAIDIVTEEEITRRGRKTTECEDSKKVEELTVEVAADAERSIKNEK
jgi:hypothetical protein